MDGAYTVESEPVKVIKVGFSDEDFQCLLSNSKKQYPDTGNHNNETIVAIMVEMLIMKELIKIRRDEGGKERENLPPSI